MYEVLGRNGRIQIPFIEEELEGMLCEGDIKLETGLFPFTDQELVCNNDAPIQGALDLYELEGIRVEIQSEGHPPLHRRFLAIAQDRYDRLQCLRPVLVVPLIKPIHQSRFVRK